MPQTGSLPIQTPRLPWCDTSVDAPADGGPPAQGLTLIDPNLSARGILAGQFDCPPGRWRLEHQGWEHLRIRRGLCEVIADSGERVRLSAGASLVIPPGFRGTFAALADVCKEFVFFLP